MPVARQPDKNNEHDNELHLHRYANPGGPEPGPDFVAFVAIDWADQKHDLVLLPAGSQTKETLTLEHTPAALSDWVAQLYRRFAQGQNRRHSGTEPGGAALCAPAL